MALRDADPLPVVSKCGCRALRWAAQTHLEGSVMSLRLTFKTLVAVACLVILPGCGLWRPWGAKSTPASAVTEDTVLDIEAPAIAEAPAEEPDDAQDKPKRSLKLALPFWGAKTKTNEPAVAKPGQSRTPTRSPSVRYSRTRKKLPPETDTEERKPLLAEALAPQKSSDALPERGSDTPIGSGAASVAATPSTPVSMQPPKIEAEPPRTEPLVQRIDPSPRPQLESKPTIAEAEPPPEVAQRLDGWRPVGPKLGAAAETNSQVTNVAARLAELSPTKPPESAPIEPGPNAIRFSDAAGAKPDAEPQPAFVIKPKASANSTMTSVAVTKPEIIPPVAATEESSAPKAAFKVEAKPEAPVESKPETKLVEKPSEVAPPHSAPQAVVATKPVEAPTVSVGTSRRSSFVPRNSLVERTDTTPAVAAEPSVAAAATNEAPTTPQPATPEKPAMVINQFVEADAPKPEAKPTPAPAAIVSGIRPAPKPEEKPFNLKSAFQPRVASAPAPAQAEPKPATNGASQWTPRVHPAVPTVEPKAAAARDANEPSLAEAPRKPAAVGSTKIVEDIATKPTDAKPTAHAPSISFAPTKMNLSGDAPPSTNVVKLEDAPTTERAAPQTPLGALAHSFTLGSTPPRPAKPTIIATPQRIAPPAPETNEAVVAVTPASPPPPVVSEPVVVPQVIVMPKASSPARPNNVVMEAPPVEVAEELPQIISPEEYRARFPQKQPQAQAKIQRAPAVAHATPPVAAPSEPQLDPAEPSSFGPAISPEDYARQRQKVGFQGFVTTSRPAGRELAPVMSPAEFERRKAVRRR